MSDLKELLALLAPTRYPRLKGPPRNVEQTLREFVIGSHAPEAPPLRIDDKLACIGSCFAEEVAKSLASQGRNAIPLVIRENWNSPFAVRHMMEHVLDGVPFPEGFIPRDINIAPPLREQFQGADAFIITLGLSLVWFEFATNRMVMEVEGGWQADNLVHKLTSHTMRQTTVEQNVEQIDAIITCLRRSFPAAPIIFTVSPIPLMRAVTHIPPITANLLSKSTLLLAVQQVMERQLDNVFYWPSYEILEWIGKNVRIIWGGAASQDTRHPEVAAVNEVMALFSSYYFPRDGGAA